MSYEIADREYNARVLPTSYQQFISTETISRKGAENERKFANGLYQIYLRELNVEDLKEQDSVSTVQKTSWTIHSSFLVLSVLKRGLFNFGCDH